MALQITRGRTMIPVGVGRSLMTSYRTLADHEIKLQRKKKMLCQHEVGKKSLLARWLLGIRF